MKTNGPWKIKESREKYKNPWMKVREDKVMRPDRKEGICGIVEMLNGVCILPIDDSGHVYLIDQFRYALEKNSIKVVGGSINTGEKMLETAKQEGTSFEKKMKEITAPLTLHRFIEPEEVSQLVCFLIDSSGSGITGQIYEIK